jgi:hypothetical protein
MKTFNLTQVVNFYAGVSNNKETVIDSFILDIVKYSSITAYPFENGVSGRDMKIVIVDNLNISLHKTVPKKKI